MFGKILIGFRRFTGDNFISDFIAPPPPPTPFDVVELSMTINLVQSQAMTITQVEAINSSITQVKSIGVCI